MKTGDTVEVRPAGSGTWIRCRVELASANEHSLALTADEGLPLGAIDRRTNRQALLLLRDPAGYRDVLGDTRYEIRSLNV